MNYDAENLRNRIIDYYGTGAQFIPAMYTEVDRVEEMSDEEIIEEAKRLRLIE